MCCRVFPQSNLIVHWDERVVRGKGPCGSLAVDEQRLLPPAHHMLLLLGYVVGHVVDDLHVKVIRRGVEGLRKCLREKEREWSGKGTQEVVVKYTVVCAGGREGGNVLSRLLLKGTESFLLP